MDNRKEYAYLLCTGGKIKKLITVWWNPPKEINVNMAAMHAAAYAFRETAAILVYEHKDGDRWELVDAYQEGCITFKPREVTITEHNEILYQTPIIEPF